MVGGVRAEETPLKRSPSLGSSSLKLFEQISVIPTYNSGIEQYSNYTKHPGEMGVGGGGQEGGLQMWKNSFCLLQPWVFCGDSPIFGKQGIGNVDYSKILLAWIVTSCFLFGLEDDFYFHSERGWMGHWSLLGVELGLDGGLCQAPVTD